MVPQGSSVLNFVPRQPSAGSVRQVKCHSPLSRSCTPNLSVLIHFTTAYHYSSLVTVPAWDFLLIQSIRLIYNFHPPIQSRACSKHSASGRHHDPLSPSVTTATFTTSCSAITLAHLEYYHSICSRFIWSRSGF
jgi:hypothetical protein